MARTIRFHLDESCDPRIAAGVRLHGIDVTTSNEAGLLNMPDAAQLAFAIAQNRVMITQDADFLRIAARAGVSARLFVVSNSSGRCTSQRR